MTETSTLRAVGAALNIEDLPAYRDWLFEGARDLEIQDPCNTAIFDDGSWRERARVASDLLDGYPGRIGIHGAFYGISYATFDAKIRQASVDRLLESLDFAAAVKATHMVIHSPFFYFGTPFDSGFTPKQRAEWIPMIRFVLAPVVARAAEQGCTLVIENIIDFNPMPLIDFVRGFESPFVRLSLDVGHAMICEGMGGATPHQWVVEGGDVLAHLHLQDTDGRADRHWAIGDGLLNWGGVFRALRELDHAPRLLIEVNDNREIARSAAWLAAHGYTR